MYIRIFLYSSICKSFEKENDPQLVHLLYQFYLFVDCKYLEIVRKKFNSYVNYWASSKFVKVIEKKVS